MAFTAAEKIQIAMLCDLAKPPKERELDFDFLWRTVVDGDLWAIKWKYSGLLIEAETPPKVKLVCDILDMWDRLEEDYRKLDDAEKARVRAESYDSPVPHFLGFDGNNETDYLHVARLLVDDLDRWSRFKGRDFNSHMPSIDVYDRMLTVWEPMWEAKTKSGYYQFSADEIILVLRERIHPSYRTSVPGGGWAFDKAKMER